ncbi:MAG: carboxypeptidase-like regulatory domain-containing protein, partial [Actinomycetota bacterium]
PVAIDTTGTSFPTDIAVFNGTVPVPVTGSCGTTSTRFFTPTATGRYLLRVGTRTLDPVGLLHLNVYALGSVSGRVIDQDGNPLQDVEVMILKAEDEWFYDWAYSDADGRYSFSQLARGNYKLFFRSDTDEYISSWYLNSIDASGAQTITVTSGPVIADDQIMPRGGSISGTVRFADGREPSACVYARTPEGYYYYDAYPQGGRFTIGGLLTGSYKIEVSENCGGVPFGIFDGEWYENATSIEFATPIAVTLGQNTSGIDIVVDPASVPANDERADALPLSNLPVQIKQGLTQATTSPSDPLACGIVGRTTWYSYAPTEDEKIFLSTYGYSATIALHAVEGNGSLSLVGCASRDWWKPSRFQVEDDKTYLLEIGSTKSEVPSGIYASLFDSDGGGSLHFDPPNPCLVQCPYWAPDRTTPQKNEDACAPSPASNEGSWQDELIQVPSTINGKVPFALGFTMDPTVDHDVWFCRVEPDSQGRYFVEYSANSPTAVCDHGLPVGCTENLDVPVEAGKNYIIRVYNWSDPGPVDATYWYVASAPTPTPTPAAG